MEKVKRKSGWKYRESICINKKLVKSSWFERKSDAKKWKTFKLAEREKMKAFGVTVTPDITFNDFSDQFLVRKQSMAQRTHDSYRSIIRNHLLPFFGSYDLRRIKLASAEEFKTNLISNKKLSSKSINNILCLLKCIMNDAESLDLILKSPLARLKNVPDQSKAFSYWIRNEIVQFLKSCQGDHFYNLYLVALNTGLRKGELLGLCWDCINFENRVITVKRNRDRYGLKEMVKSKRLRYIPFNQATFDALKHLRSISLSCQYVFTNEDGSLINYQHLTDRVFYKAVEGSGVRKITFHNLRHTYSSNFVMNDGDIFTLSKLLGHSSVSVTEKKYAHLAPDFLKDQVDVINFSVDTTPNASIFSVQ